MKTKLFNVIVYGLLFYSILTGVHAALPEQYQIAGFTNITALISGASTALVGSAGLAMKSWLTSAKVTAETKQIEIYKEFIKIAEDYKALKVELADNKHVASEQYSETTARLMRLTTLIEADLKAKLSNRLIDQEVRETISGVLEDEKEVV